MSSVSEGKMPVKPDAIVCARRELAAAQAALRVYDHAAAATKAAAELRAIDAAGGDPKALGANERDRERALVLALEADGAYRAYLVNAERAQEQVERAKLSLEGLLDERRGWEWQIRDKLATAILFQAGALEPDLVEVGT